MWVRCEPWDGDHCCQGEDCRRRSEWIPWQTNFSLVICTVDCFALECLKQIRIIGCNNDCTVR